MPEANIIDDRRCLRALVACRYNIPCLRKALGLDLESESGLQNEEGCVKEVSDALGAPDPFKDDDLGHGPVL